MKIFKIILILVIIIGIGFGSYFGYRWFKQWEANRFSEMTMLKFNQELFLKKVTELSETVTHVVNDTAKTTTTPKVDSTYVELKNEVIELKKDEIANKDEIAKLKEQLSEQRQAFLASDDTILIKKDGENILLYRDEGGTLQPASEGIEKIIEHKDVSNITIPVAKVETKKDLGLKAGGYYDIGNKGYGLIISKEILGVKSYSLNVSLLSDLKDLEGINLGGNVNYAIKDNLELGVGITIDKDYYIALEYSF